VIILDNLINVITKKGGRPPTWETPDQLQEDFRNYVDFCYYIREYDSEGNVTSTKERSEPILPNRIGFCVWKDINEDTLYQYRNNERFSEVYKKIELAFRECWLQKGYNARNPAFSIYIGKVFYDYQDTKGIITNT